MLCSCGIGKDKPSPCVSARFRVLRNVAVAVIGNKVDFACGVVLSAVIPNISASEL